MKLYGTLLKVCRQSLWYWYILNRLIQFSAYLSEMVGGYNYDLIRNIFACDAVEVLKSPVGGWRNRCFGLYLRDSGSD